MSSIVSDFFNSALNTPNTYSAPQFYQGNYQVPSYQAYTQAGQNQIAGGLAQNSNNTLAQMQGMGALNSGSTTQGLQANQNNAADAQSQLANNVGQMQYNNAYDQYLQQVQAGQNNYNNQMAQHNTNLGALEQTAGTLASALMLM